MSDGIQPDALPGGPAVGSQRSGPGDRARLERQADLALSRFAERETVAQAEVILVMADCLHLSVELDAADHRLREAMARLAEARRHGGADQVAVAGQQVHQATARLLQVGRDSLPRADDILHAVRRTHQELADLAGHAQTAHHTLITHRAPDPGADPPRAPGHPSDA